MTTADHQGKATTFALNPSINGRWVLVESKITNPSCCNIRMKDAEFTNTILKNDPSKMITKSISKMSLFGLSCLSFTVPGESTLTMTSNTTYQIQTKRKEDSGKNIIETSKGTIISSGTFSYKFITEDTQMKTTIEYNINGSGSSSGNTAIMEIIYKDNSNIVLTNEYVREEEKDKEER